MYEFFSVVATLIVLLTALSGIALVAHGKPIAWTTVDRVVYSMFHRPSTK